MTNVVRPFLVLSLALFPMLLPSSEARAETGAGDIFALDTLTLETARAADSLRQAAEAAVSTPGAVNTGADTAADVAALDGTREGRGSLSGRVASEARGTVVAGVRVIVAGRNLSVETDADGRFAIPDIEPGAYSLFLYHASYAPLTVDGLEVMPGRDLARRLLLPDKALQGEAVRITGTAGKASDAGMLFAQKNAPSVSDGISSEQISKSPDADAAAALKRVTGISIAGDGLVYVRGLGERYVNMQLNGMTVSSPNPEKRVVPLDMFPTRLLENLTVSKTFTADQPAEFAGGSLQLRTRDYPDKRVMEFSSSAGYENGSNLALFRTYKGGRFDWLGVDDGTRALSGKVPNEPFDNLSENMGSTPEERKARQQEILNSLPNTWTPYSTRAPLNQSYGVTLGNKIPLQGDRVFGWLLGGSYAAKWSRDEEFVGRIGLDGEGNAQYADRTTNDVSTESIQWGILGTSTWQDGPRHKLRFNFMINRDWEDEVSRSFGKREADNDTSLLFELTNAQQTLRNAQLEGEHNLSGSDLKLTWTGALTGASRYEPDRRVSKYILSREGDPLYNPDFPYIVGATGGLQDRYWYNSEEKGWGVKADAEYPFLFAFLEEGTKARSGVSVFSKSREFDVRQLSYRPGSQTTTLRYGHTYEEYFEVFNGDTDSGYVYNTEENPKDDYSVTDFQWAAHAQGDWVLPGDWRLITGLRYVNAKVEGRSVVPDNALSGPEREEADCEGEICVFNFGYDEAALLPAVSLVYALTEAQNLRASWTRTFSYPEYREMAPLLFLSQSEALETVGNIDLKPTDIFNYDLRWEWFPSASEIIALSGFYKHFQDPVELRIRSLGSNNRADYVNADHAELYGFEGEVRFELERAHGSLSAFQVVGNYTWIRSEVAGERKRAMQGQSPYLINAILFFEPDRGGMQMSLLYNRIGRRISKVGVDAFPDVYEEPRESLEYSWSQKIGPGVKAKFTAKNLTDAAVVQTQGGLVTRRTRPGMSFSLGASYAF
jgi:outer membrane receptor protein involved in Fe transport